MGSEVTDLDPVPADLDDFLGAWEWLSDHPYFFHWSATPRFANWPGFNDSLSVAAWRGESTGEPVVALEVGPWLPAADDHPSESAHDVDLDAAARTFEAAVMVLAKKVRAAHGDYPLYALCSHCLWRLPAGPAGADDEWFCRPACADLGAAEPRFEPTGADMQRYVPADEFCDCDRHGGSPEAIARRNGTSLP